MLTTTPDGPVPSAVPTARSTTHSPSRVRARITTGLSPEERTRIAMMCTNCSPIGRAGSVQPSLSKYSCAAGVVIASSSWSSPITTAGPSPDSGTVYAASRSKLVRKPSPMSRRTAVSASVSASVNAAISLLPRSAAPQHLPSRPRNTMRTTSSIPSGSSTSRWSREAR